MIGIQRGQSTANKALSGTWKKTVLPRSPQGWQGVCSNVCVCFKVWKPTSPKESDHIAESKRNLGSDMKILIAEDDDFFQKVLEQVLGPGHEIVVAHDGNEAWEILQKPDAPRLAILDWVMPGLSGPQVCRRVRGCAALSSMYLIILTSKNSEADIVSGLRAGADDYITKPPLPAELQARVRVGERVLELQAAVEAHSVGARTASLDEGFRLNSAEEEPFRGMEASDHEGCETGNCCSISCGSTPSFGHRLLTTSLEGRHSYR